MVAMKCHLLVFMLFDNGSQIFYGANDIFSHLHNIRIEIDHSLDRTFQQGLLQLQLRSCQYSAVSPLYHRQ